MRVLTSDEFSTLVSHVISTYDTQYSKVLDEKNRNLISDFILTNYYKDIYTFFIASELEKITESVFSNSVIRDFILNITDKVGLLLTTTDYIISEDGDFDSVIETLVLSITRNKLTSNSSSLINSQVNDTLFIDKDILKILLKDNFWLIVLYILFMFYEESNVFKTNLA